MFNFSAPKDIKFHVNKYILQNQAWLKNKIVIDIPAGSGAASQTLYSIGAKVEAYDLFPEFFKAKPLTCQYANVLEKLPIADNYADLVLCQEGIEHFANQVKALQEFNRILKPQGKLLITTPNYSNLRSKLSYFLAESEYVYHHLPPNEIDSVWLAKKHPQSEIYYGHIFLVGIQKLRVMAKLAGFKIAKIHPVRTNFTSLLILPFAYPFIWIANQLALWRSLQKHPNICKTYQKQVFREITQLNLNIRILTHGHLFVEFEKEQELSEVAQSLHGKYVSFEIVT
ncbi:MAG: class I SAM-dependent methyltransferase [Microscillaceae bacterium]|nr:class I SAM-dependent methyltransferase [Microscillaceae bacterium]MDW8460924.1 class I SAM-dependent methyltransferase [Cytophagales bacterium]